MAKSENLYLGAKERQRFDELFERRFSERPDAVSLWRSPQQVVLLFGDRGRRGVMLSRYGNGTRSAISTLSYDDEMLRNVSVGYTKLRLERGNSPLAAEGTDPDNWRQLLEDMEHMFLALPAYVPFGHVVGREIHDIIYTGFGITEFDGAVYSYGSTNRSVLEGSSLQHPASFDMPSDELSKLLWSQVDRGHLVRLGQRFRDQPGEITSVWNGTLETICFEKTDGQLPKLAPDGRRYLSWNYDEDRPSGNGRPYEPCSAPLRKWFAV